MDTNLTSESGYLEAADMIGGYDRAMSDIEVVATTASNILARGRRYGRVWLLKGLRPELRGSTTHIQQLLKEFEIQSHLQHPAVASAVALEEFDGLGLCIVMEWIDGADLAHVIEEGPTKRRRRELMMQIVDAVAYIHSMGVAHRDLKPQNIMVRRNGGAAVIIDFGFADTDAHLLLKQPGGTKDYMSEEQRQFAVADVSNDVYSLGVIMTQLCPSMRRTARRCMLPAGRRYADARALQSAIAGRRRRRKVLAAAAVALIVGATVGWMALQMSHLRDVSQTGDATIARLHDSLSVVQSRLDDETALRLAEQQQHELMQSAIAAGCHAVDSIIGATRVADPSALPYVADGLGKALRRSTVSVMEQWSPQLAPADRTVVESAIEQYTAKAYEKWFQKTIATQQSTPSS